jgi:beta-glucosidase/6-phospho-beta-glucosidase/beta-galactosidase
MTRRGYLFDPLGATIVPGGTRSVTQCRMPGCFAWSRVGRFELAWCHPRRFGWASVHCESQRRVPHSSARWYSEVTRGDGLASQ